MKTAVADPGLAVSFKARVKEMYSLWEGVYGVSLDLGDGHSYPERPVEQGDFVVTFD